MCWCPRGEDRGASDSLGFGGRWDLRVLGTANSRLGGTLQKGRLLWRAPRSSPTAQGEGQRARPQECQEGDTAPADIGPRAQSPEVTWRKRIPEPTLPAPAPSHSPRSRPRCHPCRTAGARRGPWTDQRAPSKLRYGKPCPIGYLQSVT